MNISYELYRIFYIVSKNGNITKASIELKISQPAISKAIKNLENQLGGSLFTRTKKGVILTKEGAEFYKYIEQAMLYIDNAENKFSELVNLDVGKITIGISSTMLTSIFLMPFLSDYHKLYPKINIEIVTGEISHLIKDLRNGILDLMVIMLPIEDYSDLEIFTCLDIKDYFIVGKNYPELLDRKVKLEELTKYPLIFPILDFDDRKLIDKYSHTNGVYLKPSMELSSYSLIRDFTVSGFGVGVISEIFIKDEIKSKSLYKIDVIPEMPGRGIGIGHLKKKELSFSVQRLVDIIKLRK